MEAHTERAVTRTTDENLRLSDLLINIGQAEVETTLPTCSQTTKDLYQQIEEKEAALKQMKETFDKLVAENQKHEESIENMIAQERAIKKAMDNQEKQREDKENELLVAEKILSKQLVEQIEIEKSIEESKQRQEVYEAQHSKQYTNLENAKNQLDEQIGEKEQLIKRMNDLIEAEKSLEEAVQSDRRTIKELTSHLQNLTQTLYAKQREVDQSKLKQLESQSQVQIFRQELKNKYQDQTETQQRFKTIFTDVNKSDTAENDGEPANPTQPQLAMLKNVATENKKKINHLNSTNENLVNQLLSILDEMQKDQNKQAAIQARQKVIENQANRTKVRLNAFEYEPKPTLYKEFLNTLTKSEKFAMGEEPSATDAILEKRQRELDEMQKKLANIENELQESKEKLKVSKNFYKHYFIFHLTAPGSRKHSGSNAFVSRENSFNNSLKSAKSMPSLSSIGNEEKRRNLERTNSAKLLEMKRERNNIVEEEIRKATLDAASDKRKLTDEIGLLNLEVRSYESEIKRLENDNRKLNEEKSILESEIIAKNTSFEAEEKQIYEKIHQIEDDHKNKISELTMAVEKARERLTKVEHTKNLLADELRQANVDEDNLRNRYNTFKSWKTNNNSSLNKLEHVEKQLKVEESMNSDVEKELDNLKKLFALAQERNHVTQQTLATLKPYYEEVAEFKTLLLQRTQLLHELNHLQKQLRNLELQRHGHISMSSL